MGASIFPSGSGAGSKVWGLIVAGYSAAAVALVAVLTFNGASGGSCSGHCWRRRLGLNRSFAAHRWNVAVEKRSCPSREVCTLGFFFSGVRFASSFVWGGACCGRFLALRLFPQLCNYRGRGCVSGCRGISFAETFPFHGGKPSKRSIPDDCDGDGFFWCGIDFGVEYCVSVLDFSAGKHNLRGCGRDGFSLRLCHRRIFLLHPF